MAGVLATGTVGANINYKGKQGIFRKLMFLFQEKRNEESRHKRLCYKAGVPASNTAADNPANLGDICYDVTNNHAYLCTVYDPTGAASTWVQIA
jgi:hypothetical protein